MSLKLLEKINLYDSLYKEYLMCSKENIEFTLNDILEFNFDYDNTSLVFANCKTFSKDLMTNIAKTLHRMPSGVICITTSQSIADFDSKWLVVEKLRKLMSWGCANLYIHIKT
jgi:hypothetical protein